MLTLATSVLAALPVGSAHAADAFPSPINCVDNGSGTRKCFGSFRDAVKAATNNVVTDAPVVVPEYYTSTFYNLRDRMTEANPNLSAILFSDSGFKGNGVIIVERGSCKAKNNPEHPVPGDMGGLFLWKDFGGIFDNHVNSGVGLNNCLIAFHADPYYTGIYTSPAREVNLVNTPLVDQVTSVRVWNPNT
ncbi:hypothetical protein [Streptomyces osmaniensis]|nr:hypothetical protein KJK32_46445 [Streptomyces sp. JCM17656]